MSTWEKGLVVPGRGGLEYLVHGRGGLEYLGDGGWSTWDMEMERVKIMERDRVNGRVKDRLRVRCKIYRRQLEYC